MLVLSRRVGESIVVGDDVTVTVLEVRGDVVRVGIDAPRSVRVHRAELLQDVESTNRASVARDEDATSLAEQLARRSDND
jgi:carbon storage regulator